MNELLNKIKFEYVFAMSALILLAISLFAFAGNDKVVIMIVTVLTNVVTGVSTFLYTKHQVNK